MTHETDCTVTADAEDVLDEIAEEFWDKGDVRAARRELIEHVKDEYGWENIGGGAGREVFRVTDEKPHRDDPTESAPCVVKFAVKHNRWDGKRQNRNEVRTWNDFPPEIRNADPPILAPVKDWADDYHWLSMPLAFNDFHPTGRDVNERLLRYGWDCSGDLHRDNLATMHQRGVIIDYGLNCEETDMAEDEAEQFETYLEGEMEDPDVLINVGSPTDAEVEWTDGRFGNAAGDPPRSNARIRHDGWTWLSLEWGPFLQGRRGALREAVEKVDDELHSEYWNISHSEPMVYQQNGNTLVSLTLELRRGEFDTFRFGDLYTTAAEEFELQLRAEGMDLEGAANEIIRELHNVTAFGNEASEPMYETDEEELFVRFGSSTADPGFKPQQRAHSAIVLDPKGMKEAHFTFGPYLADEPRKPTLSKAGHEVWSRMETLYGDEMKMEYHTMTLPSGDEEFEFAQLAFGPPEVGGRVDMGPEEYAELYAAVLEQVREVFPRAVAPGDPKQQRLDEIEGSIASAVEDAF